MGYMLVKQIIVEIYILLCIFIIAWDTCDATENN